MKPSIMSKYTLSPEERAIIYAAIERHRSIDPEFKQKKFPCDMTLEKPGMGMVTYFSDDLFGFVDCN